MILLACVQGLRIESVPEDEQDSGGRGVTDTADTGDAAEPGECDALEPLPVADDYVRKIQNSEDFAFDLAGNLWNVNQMGALVSQTIDGEATVVKPNAGAAAGIRVLPGGDIAFNNVATNTIDRITPEGEQSLIAGGLAYPNGLALGMDGWLYVAENGAGRVRRVDPATGAEETLAEGLYMPNGVAWSPDYTTLYVGSFGGGVVYAIDHPAEDQWQEARVYGTVPGAPELPDDDCVDLSPGDTCYLSMTGGMGACSDASVCTLDRDTAACEGRIDGDTCDTTLFDQPMTSECRAVEGTDEVYCSRVETDRIEACAGAGAIYADCTLEGEHGYCYQSWEGPLTCVTDTEGTEMYLADCRKRTAGEACMMPNPAGPSPGVCTDYSEYGYPDLYCVPPWWAATENGGLDGIAADACGNVYATEYIAGKVWRFSAEGAEAELVAELDSAWIPNLHWGLGVGGWERDILYVMNLDRRGMFSLALGVGGAPDAMEALSEP